MEHGGFEPSAEITREQAVTMLARAMKLTGLNPSLDGEEAQALIAGFTDGDSVSGYAQPGMAAALKSGLVAGRDSTRIAPSDAISRAEVAVLISRLLKQSDLM
jgi:hypothetical protein